MSARPEGQQRIDDNLVVGSGGDIRCRHCDTQVGERNDHDYLSQAMRLVRSPSAAGPQVREDASLFVDREMVMRQIVCPTCATALETEVVPRDDPSYRSKAL